MFQNSSRRKLSRSLAGVVSVIALLLSSATPAIAESEDLTVSIEVYSSFVDPCTFEPVPVIWSPSANLSYDDMEGLGRYDTEAGSQVAEASFYVSWTDGSDSCGDDVFAGGTVTSSLTMSEASISAGLDEFTLVCKDLEGNAVAGCTVPYVYEVAAKITIPADTVSGIYTGLMNVTWVP